MKHALQIILALLIPVLINADENDVFIIGDNFCLTNGTSAIFFEKPQDNYSEESITYPVPPDSDFNCKFEEEMSTCVADWFKNDWHIEDSLRTTELEIIRDRRWESFPTIKTVITVDQKNYYYHPAADIDDSMTIPISVKAEQEAHIFLCDTSTPEVSTCYWITLGGQSGAVSTIRKCLPNGIPIALKTYSSNSCKIDLVKKKENMLDKKKWVHFFIQKFQNLLKIFTAGDNGPTLFMELDDPYWITPKKLFVHNKRDKETVLWKIHKYYYLASTLPDITKELGPVIQIFNNQLCVSMFIKTAVSSSLDIHIRTRLRNDVNIKRNFSTNGKWQYFKMYIDTESRSPYTFYVRKRTNDMKGFWAIDEIRECSETEYRYLRGEGDSLNCQKLEEPVTLQISKKMDTVNADLPCSTNTFGRACVPCEIFGTEFCPSFKYCERYSDAQTCYCTAGYNNSKCEECIEKRYGHGCSQLSNCIQPYNKKNGYCNGNCDSLHTGMDCREVIYPYFIHPPKVYDIGPRGFKVVQENLSVDGFAESYHFELSESDEENWQKIGEQKPIGNSEIEEIFSDIIKPDTDYKVRTLLKPSGRTPKTTLFGNSVTFATDCTLLTDNRVKIETNSTSASVEIKFPPNRCQLKRYEVYLDDTAFMKLNKTHFIINNLRSYSEHILSIRFTARNSNDIQIISKTFRTREGEPSVVRNIKMTNLTPTKAVLSWEEPEESNGVLTGYQISYKVLKRLACTTQEDSQYINKTTQKLSFHIEPIIPFSEYEVHVRAETKDYLGKDNSIIDKTFALDDFTGEETLEILEITPFSYGVQLEVSDLKCSVVYGPLIIRYELVCLSDWCVNASEIFNYKYIENVTTAYLQRPSITAFTNYNMTLRIVRGNKDKYGGYRNFTTSSGVANPISELQTYNQSLNSIYLRWRPPYPPTGILEKYKISYSGYYSRSKEVNIEPCTFWKEYHCATVTETIYPGYTYTIEVSAKNENHDYGENSNSIYVTIGKKGPTKVYNLDYSWTETNDLNISFYHPNNTNGQLRSFDVLINDVYKKNHEVYSHYMPIYFYQEVNVSWTFDSCTNINVCIVAYNVYAPSGPQCISAKTPPGLPPDIKQITYSSTNTTITLNIEIEKNLVSMQKCYIFICYANQKCDVEEIQHSILQNQESNLNFSRLVYNSSYVNSTFDFVIGTNDNDINPPLDPGTNYNLLVILSNTCNDMTRIKIGQKYATTMGNMVPVITTAEPLGPTDGFIDDTTAVNGLWALLLLLIIPGFIVWYVWKKHPHVTQLMKSQPKQPLEDQLALTDTPPIKPNVRVIKPKPSIKIEAPKTKHSKKIKIIEYESYVKNSVTNGELKRQHDLFPRGLIKPHNVGSSAENKIKNRYKNLIAYDHTRVKLKRPPGDDQNDYINANFIDGYKKPRTYIATQGPKANTVTDFWMMIWQRNVCNIIMLANVYENGKKKVEKYWPDINEDNQYGDFKIHYKSSSVHANFEERIFLISYQNEERTITQLHFTTWPDHGVPLYSQSLVPFLQKMLKIPYNPHSPMVVHCSAGVGRTGTIILSDIILRMAAAENSVDFLAYLELIREQRANLVDNLEQYKLAHLVVLECLFGMRTAILCNDDMRTIVENTISNNGIKTQMKYILETQWQDSAMETILDNDEVSPIYKEKNRFEDIIPENYRVFITRYPHEDESSSYINAILVDDFRNPGRFIVTQQPMPNTIGDFWRMVMERSCSVIISLNTVDLQDETVCQIWPEKNEELNPVDFIKIVHKKTRRLEFYTIITLELTTQLNGGDSKSVDVIALDNWRHEDLLPNSIEEFLAFRDAAEATSRTSESVIVMCYDGSKASGLYLALSFIIEKMKMEQECDVCLAVRTVRHSRKQFVTTEEQYEFLYRAALAYITGFQPYSNFA